jgi:hypothetical protein
VLVALTLLTLAAGLALAFGGPRRARALRWAHRGLATGLIALAFVHGAWLMAGTAVVVASAGLLAAHLPDRDWGLTLLICHVTGAILLLVIAGLGAQPGPGPVAPG